MPSCERGNLERELKRDLALLSDAVEKPTDQAQGSYAATLVCSKNSSGHSRTRSWTRKMWKNGNDIKIRCKSE
jgi:hypothetical protein